MKTMSDLTNRIAAEHRHIPGTHLPDRCTCGWEADDGTAGTWQQHFAQAVEAAVREQVARDIEATYLGPDFGRNPITGQDSPYAMHAWAYDEGLADAARIARGERP